MVETDWREILSFSHKELKQADKEKLCESLSWMEADDIELNFTDLKTLFRLAQDILKYKNEQVNNLIGQLESSKRKDSKSKPKDYLESPTRSSESVFETLSHQEEVIRANKEILEQLYADIAELQYRKTKLIEERNNTDKESESSRDVLSEINAITELENEITKKNRHIRKLLSDIKTLEEENTQVKEKISVLKEKLSESTSLIENLTQQLYVLDNECIHLKEAFAKSEQEKTELSVEIESLRREVSEKKLKQENTYEEIKSKIQHWKNIARSRKTEIEALSSENTKLKEDLIHASKSASAFQVNIEEETKMKELQEKLLDASKEILESAKIIENLKMENKELKMNFDMSLECSVLDTKNESDDGKEKAIISTLKRKNNILSKTLQNSEECLAIKEKELTEISSQLQLLQSDKGVNSLINNLKTKKQQLKFKDETIKSLVDEVNTLNNFLNDLQIQNEFMRQKLNLPPEEKVPSKGILKKFRSLEMHNMEITKKLKEVENNAVSMELENHNLNKKVSKLVKLLNGYGFSNSKIKQMFDGENDEEVVCLDEEEENSNILSKDLHKQPEKVTSEEDFQAIIEENEGLRKGLQEILDFLKDNSTTSSGVLALKCPSLEAVLQSLEARHSAGWFAPHMAAVLELRAALGGKDALLTALHEARKETFDVMAKLSEQSQKSVELEKKLQEIKCKSKTEIDEEITPPVDVHFGEFGDWIFDKERQNINLHDKQQINDFFAKENALYENQLLNVLVYFHKKFKDIFEKLTSLTVQTADERNKWSIQEEKYKAEIENLKAQLCENEDEDTSDSSPGLINSPNVNFWHRKCTFLEESYKHIRTLNENLKNEFLESNRQTMMLTSDYEKRIQRLLLTIVDLTDKLRNSVGVDLFWKQNESLHETTLKYRQLTSLSVKQKDETLNLFMRLENDKADIINFILKEKGICEKSGDTTDETKTSIKNVEHTILKNQLQQLCRDLDEKDILIKRLEEINLNLQGSQTKLIDDTMSTTTKQEIAVMKHQIYKLSEDNKILKEHCKQEGSRLKAAMLQLHDIQHGQMRNDIEINMLRHQLLDLQSTSDSKAVVARLSNEILTAHLQISENLQKIESLTSALNTEKQHRIEVEEMLTARQKIFDVYAFRYESKFRYMFEVMEILRCQYQGSIPLISIENYLNKVEEISRKTHAVNEKLNSIEELQSDLMTKHSVYEQILDISKSKCLEGQDACTHKLKYIVMQGMQSHELDHLKKKLLTMEHEYEAMLKHCNHLEKSLVLVSQGFRKNTEGKENIDGKVVPNLELEDVQSDDDSNSRRSQTIILPKPKVLKMTRNSVDLSNIRNDIADTLPGSPIKVQNNMQEQTLVNVFVQTCTFEVKKIHKMSQTDVDSFADEIKLQLTSLKNDYNLKSKELSKIMASDRKHLNDFISVKRERDDLEMVVHNLKETIIQKDNFNDKLRSNIDDLRKRLEDFKTMQLNQMSQTEDSSREQHERLLQAIDKLENEKKTLIDEYKALLCNEREEYSNSVRNLNSQLKELQTRLENKDSDAHTSSGIAMKEVLNKYTLKNSELENKCFKLQNELDECKSKLASHQNEVDRWKTLASERLNKMEMLSSQLEERHCQEVESYKAENQHWLSQLNETQKEHIELRSRLSEQKNLHIKQLADKDAQIEQLRSLVNNLKTQIMNMQTVMSVNDPSFDLSAIVEVDESSDAASQQGYDKLEIKFDSSVDIRDMQDDIVPMPVSSSAIWQESVIERLRREKQTIGKQNAILRRQVKVLAARERRARLDAQNLKNQVYRISTSSSKTTSVETASLHNKIASLQGQLASARKQTHSSVALWDKWKRCQQSSERWQMRYEEKCQDEKKLEASLNLARSTINRLEKEKRVLLHRLAEMKSESQSAVEKQDVEYSEKCMKCMSSRDDSESPPVSSRALLERVEAQQRRIVALEISEKGNEVLVAEYEKSLAEITALKGQLLKLESTLLESQIRSPIKTNPDTQPELQYWKSYCEMLKQENVQLTMKVNTMDLEVGATAPAAQQRIHDLEQTVLTLRGLVSKLQSEQKSFSCYKRYDSRPSSVHSLTDKVRSHPMKSESFRIEIANLKRSIQDKDCLLERSKEMLKIAAEREDDLLRENALLRRRLNELSKPREGFSSA